MTLEPGSTVKVEDSPSAPHQKRHERTAMATPCELAELGGCTRPEQQDPVGKEAQG